MMDWEDSSGNCSSEDEADDMWNVPKAVSNLRDTGSNNTGSMRGLQLAVAEGWLITRARDMCSFSHDRYRQAAQAEAENLPKDVAAKMSFRVRHKHWENGTTTYDYSLDYSEEITRASAWYLSYCRTCETVRRSRLDSPFSFTHHCQISCLSLLHDHPERGAILDVLIDAGESAWACGAHEVRTISTFITNLFKFHSSPYNPFSMPGHFSGKISGRRRRPEHCICYLDLQRELFERKNSGILLTHTCRLFTWKGEQYKAPYIEVSYNDFQAIWMHLVPFCANVFSTVANQKRRVMSFAYARETNGYVGISLMLWMTLY